MASASSLVLAIAAFVLMQTPTRADHDAGAALALAKAKATNVKRIAANTPIASPAKCDGTCCDDIESARKRAWEKKLPIVLYIGTAPKPDDVKAIGDLAVVCKVRDYEADLDPKDAEVYKAAPRVWLLTIKPTGFELTTRWAAGQFTGEKAIAALRPPKPQ